MRTVNTYINLVNLSSSEKRSSDQLKLLCVKNLKNKVSIYFMPSSIILIVQIFKISVQLLYFVVLPVLSILLYRL